MNCGVNFSKKMEGSTAWRLLCYYEKSDKKVIQQMPQGKIGKYENEQISIPQKALSKPNMSQRHCDFYGLRKSRVAQGVPWAN